MINQKEMDKFIAIDSFCGAGGLSLGLEQAGFKLGFAFDNNEWAVKSYNKYFNTDKHCFLMDVRELKGSTILEKLNIKKGELDLWAGGPPCQGFSRQKRGAHNGDARNSLVLEFSRLVQETLPKVFLLENVDMLGLKRGREFLDKIKENLDDYDLFPEFYNSANYGLAQTRVRFITVGVRSDLRLKYEVPSIIEEENWKTVGEIIGHLPEPPDDYSVHSDYFNHQKSRVTPLNIERFSHVPQGGGWKDIPFDLRLKCHQVVDTTKGGWPDVYGRLEWNGQCPTITGGFDSFTRGRYGHPLQNRAITPREAALLQGFPVDFEFIGNRSEVRKQIGNAVPPPLAKAIGISIINLWRV